MISVYRQRLIAQGIEVSGFLKAGEIQYFTGIRNGNNFEVMLRSGTVTLLCNHIQTRNELWYLICYDDTAEESV